MKLLSFVAVSRVIYPAFLHSSFSFPLPSSPNIFRLFFALERYTGIGKAVEFE
jgi:hypothetical protein